MQFQREETMPVVAAPPAVVRDEAQVSVELAPVVDADVSNEDIAQVFRDDFVALREDEEVGIAFSAQLIAVPPTQRQELGALDPALLEFLGRGAEEISEPPVTDKLVRGDFRLQRGAREGNSPVREIRVKVGPEDLLGVWKVFPFDRLEGKDEEATEIDLNLLRCLGDGDPTGFPSQKLLELAEPLRVQRFG